VCRGEAYEDLRRDVLDRQLDPYSAADEILAWVGSQ